MLRRVITKPSLFFNNRKNYRIPRNESLDSSQVNLTKLVNFPSLKHFSSYKHIPQNTIEPIQTISTDYKQSHIDKIKTNNGLRKYMSDIYTTTGKGISTSIAIGGLTASLGYLTTIAIPQSIFYLGGLYVGNIFYSFYSLHKLCDMKSEVIQNGNEYEEKISEKKRNLYYKFVISEGITLSPIIFLAHTISPIILPSAIIGTLGVSYGASYYSLKQKNFEVAKWQEPLIGGVFGMIAMSIVNLGAYGLGYTEVANTLNLLTTGGSLFLFTGLIAADTQKAIKDYQEGKLDSINTSIDLLLDLLNILLDIIKVMLEAMKNK